MIFQKQKAFYIDLTTFLFFSFYLSCFFLIYSHSIKNMIRNVSFFQLLLLTRCFEYNQKACIIIIIFSMNMFFNKEFHKM